MHIYCCHDCRHCWSQWRPLEECPNCGGANGQPVCRDCLSRLLGASHLVFCGSPACMCCLCGEQLITSRNPGIVITWPPAVQGRAICARCVAERELVSISREKVFAALREQEEAPA
jgi:hypothetical protein